VRIPGKNADPEFLSSLAGLLLLCGSFTQPRMAGLFSSTRKPFQPPLTARAGFRNLCPWARFITATTSTSSAVTSRRMKKMPDVFTKAKRSEVMAAIRSTGNKATELKIISIFRARGITGWRRNQKLPGKPDFVFKRGKIAVFVDGCFWHGCKRHCRLPQTNRHYWQEKIARNAMRDKETNHFPQRIGWRVCRVWEHSLNAPAVVSERIKSLLSDEG
jgi:DNA mismatch endonuclease, patch repair protein